ncbi:uncharacterized protein LOC122240403 isoform X3 [Panthera tigris]|uniref:uncharacterized protein LOC122240403 isoform X3 n=1 Tax=Panthera tigris TaxID=9694 RepID=UPI001C6FA8BF|nr:uncharacterized protein LOC122240403 isoform X3 [Panthera tigris]
MVTTKSMGTFCFVMMSDRFQNHGYGCIHGSDKENCHHQRSQNINQLLISQNEFVARSPPAPVQVPHISPPQQGSGHRQDTTLRACNICQKIKSNKNSSY